jgi:hypothetical protein
MGKPRSSLTPELEAFLRAQPVFFVATAPLSPSGHVNLSPKGLDTLRVLGADRIAYLDLTGSGNETAAHLEENGRITFLFCAFSGAPRILRLYGAGRVVRPGSDRWAELEPLFPVLPGIRQIIEAELRRVQTSCGFGVPELELIGPRDTLLRWAEAKGPEALLRYQVEKNSASIDGLPVRVGPERQTK